MLVFAAPAAAADHPVAFGGSHGNAYDPKDLTIAAGDTVTFSGSFSTHPLVWDSGTPGVTESGSTMQFDFPHPGTYTYYCRVHVNTDNMRGVIRVPDQHPAYVSFSVSPAAPRVGQPVTFTYTGSADPDGSLVRWEWDLDGDGSFETATPTGAASTTYASARTVTVRMRAVDDSGEASAVAAQAVTVVAAGSGSGSGSGASGSRDTTAPKATLVKLRGLKLTFRSSERASATATLRARGKTLASGSAKAKSGAIVIRLRLTKAGRPLLPRGHKLRAKLTLTLRDASGNRGKVTRQLTVKRS
ncbi:MAG TPA: PKD domain-containing protein [Solirubrobacteraceae bacterium]